MVSGIRYVVHLVRTKGVVSSSKKLGSFEVDLVRSLGTTHWVMKYRKGILAHCYLCMVGHDI